MFIMYNNLHIVVVVVSEAICRSILALNWITVSASAFSEGNMFQVVALRFKKNYPSWVHLLNFYPYYLTVMSSIGSFCALCIS